MVAGALSHVPRCPRVYLSRCRRCPLADLIGAAPRIIKGSGIEHEPRSIERRLPVRPSTRSDSEKTRHRQMSKASKLARGRGGGAKRSRRARCLITRPTSSHHLRAASPARFAPSRCLRDLGPSTCCHGSNPQALRSTSRRSTPEFDVRDNSYSIREFLRTQSMRSAGGRLGYVPPVPSPCSSKAALMTRKTFSARPTV